ncbi:MAG: glycosyltransferase [Verrucomicrobia bacterium]|nr:glycosyltransferase [Verrucomicrobiota bacterium]
MSVTVPETWTSLHTTLCHDWLTGMRGGERVLELLCEGFPEAEICTLIHNRDVISEGINRHNIQTSPLQHVPGIFQNYRLYLPLFPSLISHFAPRGGDLVISTSHCVAKSIRTAPGTRHLCYCFTPMRYAWLFQDEYFGRHSARSLAVSPVLAWLRRWDRRTADRVTHFVAISKHTQKRIRDFYGRTSDIVYPPIDTSRFRVRPESERVNFDLVVSALVPYKRIDLAIQTYNRLGTPLRIVGVGGELPRLKQMAGPNITFLEWQADDAIEALYGTCRQLIFPGEEDFGLVPLEAQACGTPVIAYGRGGALETVINKKTGLYFNDQTVESLCQAVLEGADTRWNRDQIRTHAEGFGIPGFIEGMSKAIERCLAGNLENTDSGG